MVWSVLLAVIVVAAAGITGKAHFGGPRWVPNLSAGPSRIRTGIVSVPQQAKPPRTIKSRPFSFPLGTVLLGILIGLVVIAIAVFLWRWWTGRPSRAAPFQNTLGGAATSVVPSEPEPEPDTPALRTGIDLALQVLDEPDRDPADAIVRAWLGLQETAEESGITRRPAETPTEFTSRILRGAIADDRAIKTLLRLYLRTRFGDHPATQEDVAEVRAALQELLRTWPAPASTVGGRSR